MKEETNEHYHPSFIDNENYDHTQAERTDRKDDLHSW